jgi:bifunctional DNA-binding transcriptional regulator/antitoxin component of YhaV-PrlF toxin-antitoxin module
MPQSNNWIVQVIEEDGDLILPLPFDVLKVLNAKEGDMLKWIDNNDGTYTIEKSDEN